MVLKNKQKILVIIAAVVVISSGTVGYAVISGAIYLGPSIPKITITGNGTTDVGMNVSFGVSADGKAPYPLQFFWSSDHNVGTGTTFTTSFSSPGTYYVSLLVSMDSNHTRTTVRAKEIVNKDPTVSITENKNVIDAGQNITFTSSVSGGTAPYTYAWTYPGSSSADPTMQLYSDIGGVYVTVTDAAGYSINSNILNPTINPDPYVVASSNTTYTDVGSPVGFSASPSGGTSPYSYSWTWNGNVISTSPDFSYSFDQSGQQYVYVNVKDKVGETATNYVIIEVEKDPTVSISASQQTGSPGADVSFIAETNYGTSPFSYSWYINGVYEGGSSVLYYTFNNAGNYNVEVIVTDAAGQRATGSITETIT
ncbi:MAG: PKD domain-containing protein [Thermoplasmatales archaeon]|nr:MAG: PKD domain-containing protein [Thermoplasmatales archaeon]